MRGFVLAKLRCCSGNTGGIRYAESQSIERRCIHSFGVESGITDSRRARGLRAEEEGVGGPGWLAEEIINQRPNKFENTMLKIVILLKTSRLKNQGRPPLLRVLVGIGR